MQTVLKYSGRAELAVLALIALVIALFLLAGPAFAGADTTFDTALTKFTDFLEGSGGKIITVLSLAGGIVALASGRFSMGQIAIPVGVGVGAGTGIPIVTSTVTATCRFALRIDPGFSSRIDPGGSYVPLYGT